MATLLVQYFMEEETQNHISKEKSLVQDYGRTWLEQMVIFFSMKLPKDTSHLRILVWQDLLVQYLLGLAWNGQCTNEAILGWHMEVLLPCIKGLLLSQRVWKEDSAEKDHTDRDQRRTVPPRRGLPVEESPSGGCSWIERRDQDNAKIPGSCGLTALPRPCLPRVLKLFRRQRSN